METLYHVQFIFVQLYSDLSFIVIVKQFSGEMLRLCQQEKHSIIKTKDLGLACWLRGEIKSKEGHHKPYSQLSRSSSENEGAGSVTCAPATFQKRWA